MFLFALRSMRTRLCLMIAAGVLMWIITACTPATVISPDLLPAVTGRVTTDSDLLDFGTWWSERLCSIAVPQPDTRWSITLARKSVWLSVPTYQGTGNALVSIRVNRGVLAQGMGRDTLIFHIIKPDGTLEIARRLPVVATNDGTIKRVSFIQNFLEEQAGFLASSLQLPPVDTNSSLFISAGRISPDGFPQAHALLACGVQSPLPFVDLQNTVLFSGNNAIVAPLAVQRRGFSYVSARTSANAVGAINMPNTLPIAPAHIVYDEHTWHNWSTMLPSSAVSLSGGVQSTTQPAWRDSILSPAVPTWIGISDTLNINQDFRVRWLPTVRDDDMMLLVIPGLDGWRILQAIVSDNQGQYIFSAQQVRSALAGRTGQQIALYLVRYRTKHTRYNNQPAQMVSVIQRGYNLVVR
jgi:hypothetical protein